MSSDPVSLAVQMRSAGRVAEAVALLANTGNQGHVMALAELATWYLAGEAVPRDLPAARALLKRAVAIGHVDAALMEIALTANGSGAAPDWRAAIALLERAAMADPLAGQHLQILRSMAIRADGTPSRLPPPKALGTSPAIRLFRNFCTETEAVHIGSAVAATLTPATVFDPASNRMVAHPIRSSDNAPIGPTQETLVIQAINRRIAAATRTDFMQGEPLTVLRYGPGQQYRPHLDTLPNPANQRILTAILYLNEGYRGGETVFPLLDVKIVPRTGDLLVFENVDAQGAPEPRSRHAGLPVISGTKWIATRWIRARPTSAWALSEEARAAARGG